MKISGFAVAAVAGLAAIAAVPFGVSPAKAQTLGTASIEGPATTNTTTNTIAFAPGNGGVVGVQVTTGNLMGAFAPAGTVTMIGAGSPVNYTTPGAWIGTNLFGSTPEDFRISTFAENINGNSLNLSGTGVFSGRVNTPGTWDLTTQLLPGVGNNPTTFSLESVSVPGPIVGAGLPGLIAGLGGLVAMARRRRKQLA